MERGRTFYSRNVKDNRQLLTPVKLTDKIRIDYDEDLDGSVYGELLDNSCDSDKEMEIFSFGGKAITTGPDVSQADSEKDSVAEFILEHQVHRCDSDDNVREKEDEETLHNQEPKNAVIDTSTKMNNIKIPIPSEYHGFEVILTPPTKSLESVGEEGGSTPQDLVDRFCDVHEMETASEISGKFPDDVSETTLELQVSKADSKVLDPGNAFDTNTIKGNSYEEPLLNPEVEAILFNINNTEKPNIKIQSESTGFEIVLTPKNLGLVKTAPDNGNTSASIRRKSEFECYSVGKPVQKSFSPVDCPLLGKKANIMSFMPGCRVPDKKAKISSTRSSSPFPTKILPASSRMKKSDCYPVRKPVQKILSSIRISSLSSDTRHQEIQSNKLLARSTSPLPAKILTAASRIRKSDCFQVSKQVQKSSSLNSYPSSGILKVQELKSNKFLVRSTSPLPTKFLPSATRRSLSSTSNVPKEGDYIDIEDNTVENTCETEGGGRDRKVKVFEDLIKKLNRKERELNRKERENRKLKTFIRESNKILEQANTKNEDKSILHDVIDIE